MFFLHFFESASKLFYDNPEMMLASMQFFGRRKIRTVSEQDIAALHQNCFENARIHSRELSDISAPNRQYCVINASETFQSHFINRPSSSSSLLPQKFSKTVPNIVYSRNSSLSIGFILRPFQKLLRPKFIIVALSLPRN